MNPSLPAHRLAAGLEEQDDLYYGQIVVIVARWFLIFAGVGLALWTANTVSALLLPIGLMVVLMAINFYLHGRYLLKKPVKGPIVLATSAIDLLVITLLTAFWANGHGTGMQSPFFVFYYPVLLAAALVFPPRLSLPCAALGLLAYAVVAVPGSASLADQKGLLERLLTLAATSGLGMYFWRIQRRPRGNAWRRSPLSDSAAGAVEPVLFGL